MLEDGKNGRMIRYILSDSDLFLPSIMCWFVLTDINNGL